jgi:small conductance mechanosensitive channel
MNNHHVWRKTNILLVPCAVLFIGGAIISSVYGNLKRGNFDHKLVALLGVILFVIFAVTFLHVLTNAIQRTIIFHRLGVGRAAALQFILRTFGYLTILLTAIDHLGIPVGHILLGSAVLGIILGVAAQQALGNFFASIVLIVSHPFSVGEQIAIVSGALGGKYEGRVVDIGLTHTRLQQEDGDVIYLPNSTLLSAAAISTKKREKVDKSSMSNKD